MGHSLLEMYHNITSMTVSEEFVQLVTTNNVKARDSVISKNLVSTGWPVCNDMKQGSVNQVF